MERFSRDETEYALACLTQLLESRGLTQTQLQQASGVPQSTISKVLNRTQEPTTDVLRKLFKGMGFDLNDIIHESSNATCELMGYLATPLTGLSDAEDHNLRKVVGRLKATASSEEFQNPRFDLYWPGDFTHPKDNANFTGPQVYRTDRARASSFNFIVLLCAAPSFGVGQENEIATQAGLPAIRLVPEKISRMMEGSFLKAKNLRYTGSLATGIAFDESEFKEALRSIQIAYFAQLPLFRNLNGNDFGERLRRLISERSGNSQDFADRLGVSLGYVQVMQDEPFVISNPSARLLKRMALLLGVSVGYLLGETRDADPIWLQSHASWRSWMRDNPTVEANVAVELWDQWKAEYHPAARTPSILSFRDGQKAMTVIDWDKRYKQRLNRKAKDDEPQTTLF